MANHRKVYLEITNVCNLRCAFCPGTTRPSHSLTEAEFSVLLDRVAPWAEYLYYHLMGEPTAHPLLPRFMEMAADLGMKSVITTNGTLLPHRGTVLLAAGVHKVNLSLHSFEDGTEDDHIRYIRGLADFAKSAAEAGTIVAFRLWNNCFDGGKNDFALRVLKEQIDGAWVENSRGLRIRDKIFIEFGERFEWPDSNEKIKGEKFFCYGLKDQFGILVDGTVVPCCLDSDGVINLGNIFEEDIESILSSKRAEDMVEGFRCGKASEDLCKRCGYAQRFV